MTGPLKHNAVRNSLSTLAFLVAGYLALSWAEANFDGYQTQLLNLVAINAILAVSLNFIYGFSGMFSLGHAGFMAIGAYVSALCILPPAQKELLWLLEPIYGPLAALETPFVVSVLLGGLAAAATSLLIALPVMRLGGDYLGIATLGFAEIIRVLFTNLAYLTNGAIGLRGIPSYAGIWWNYGWLAVTLFVVLSMLKSNFGNVLKSIRDDEIAAGAMGINTSGYRTMAFCLGGFFAGVGGALMGSLVTTIEPKMFNFQLTFNILLIVVAGGLGSITGSVVGAAAITLLLEWLRIVEAPLTLNFALAADDPQLCAAALAVCLASGVFWLRKWRRGARRPAAALAGRLIRGLTLALALTALALALTLALALALAFLGLEMFPDFTLDVPGIPGMRMVIFSVALMCIILFRREGLLGVREFSWDGFYDRLGRLARRLGSGGR
ncbi:MAG: branched-chain amino acid ABC transporter permease [Candidatus Adiutrix sp.]|jgi:branched-chain amino acid transport system permease protein|nr:branched-chain amino acid ABC transporter permease [Candidatus Adiutrix sp.]